MMAASKAEPLNRIKRLILAVAAVAAYSSLLLLLPAAKVTVGAVAMAPSQHFRTAAALRSYCGGCLSAGTMSRRASSLSSSSSRIGIGGSGVGSRPPFGAAMAAGVGHFDRAAGSRSLFSPTTALFSSTVSNNSPSSSPDANQDHGQQQQRKEEGDETTSTKSTTTSEYEQLVRKLYMTNLFNPVKLGLDNMHRLHRALGKPMEKYDVSVVHVAGSNGKGSVALKIANTLRVADFKVGLFVSPHISSFRERIQIDGKPLSEAQVIKYLSEIYDICEKEGIPATFFEITTALAFRAFAAEGCEAVILETGLGGRLDATNVVKSPALSVVTSIALEHTRILGDTVEKIAFEKGGIIKKGRPVLVGRNVPPDALDALWERADDVGASEFYRSEDVLGDVDDDPIVIYDGPEGGEATFEDYDAENSRMASAAVILLQFHFSELKNKHGGGYDVKLVNPRQIEEGVGIRPPCRFEEMDIPVTIAGGDGGNNARKKIVRVVLDVAHNPQAMDYLLVKLRSTYPNIRPAEQQRIVVGMSADKDLGYCTKILMDHLGQQPERIHLVEASHPRAASVSSILEANPKLADSHHEDDGDLNEHGRDASSVSRQVRKALDLAARNDELLVICGSVFIMADAREELGIIEPRDSAVIAEVAGAGMRNSQENFGKEKK